MLLSKNSIETRLRFATQPLEQCPLGTLQSLSQLYSALYTRVLKRKCETIFPTAPVSLKLGHVAENWSEAHQHYIKMAEKVVMYGTHLWQLQVWEYFPPPAGTNGVIRGNNITNELKITDLGVDKMTQCDNSILNPNDLCRSRISQTFPPQLSLGRNMTWHNLKARQTLQWGSGTDEGTPRGHVEYTLNGNLRLSQARQDIRWVSKSDVEYDPEVCSHWLERQSQSRLIKTHIFSYFSDKK